MINNGHIQILLRRRQNQANYPLPDDPLIDVIVVGDALTGEAKYLPGTVDNTTPFMDIVPVDGWYDFSNYIEDEEKMTFTWDKVNQGDSKNSETSKEGSNYDKGISATLFFFDKGFQFVHDWLILFDYQIINCVEVRIIDLTARAKQPDPAGNYRIFEIKVDNLDYAPIDHPCELHVKLREQDMIWHCIHKTEITDDWQGWFNKDGASTFDHPTFLTCIEGRPRLVQSARMALMMFYNGAKTGIFPIALLIDWITGAPSAREDARRIMNANRFIDAPFIRTYIQNVALKCNMTTNTIFDENRDWENLCLFFPRAGDMHESDDDAIVSPNQHFHYGNRWLITIPDLFDRLKVLFCAEWYVTPNNQIIFEYKKNLITVAAIYDFTLPDSLPFYDLRYTFNGDKRPAYGEYRYQADPVDEASQEINALYSDAVSFDHANNPMLEGEIQKNFDFGATGFVRDGRAKDYMRLLINDGEFGALILLVILALISGALVITSLTVVASPVTIPLIAAIAVMLFATATAIAKMANNFRDDFENNDAYTGAVRLTAEQTTVPRLLLWDGVQTDRAKVVRINQLPIANPYYNPELINYDVKNIINKDNPGNNIFNYPLYFDGFYYGNMFPNYHDVVDNPLKSKETHQTAKFWVDLCEFMQNLLGFFEGQYVQIGKLMKVETRDNYDVFVRIGNILEDYGSNRIEITGQVLRRPVVNGVVIYPPREQGPGSTPPPDPVPPDPTPPPTGPVCYRWQNNGTETSLVTYIDCEGVLQTDILIGAGDHFCALSITAATPDTIIISDVCTDPDDPDPDPECHRFINLEPNGSDNISYIDCDGVLVVGVTVPFNGTFCALEIITRGCSSLVDIGPCEPCEPCCLPEFISATTGTEGPCVPIGTIEFLLPDGSIGFPYEHRQSLDVDGASPPYIVNVTSAPAWMSITVDEDTNEIVFSGTPDEPEDNTEVNFTITNCGEAGFLEVGTFIFVDASGAMADANIDQEICSSDTATLDGTIGGTADNGIWTTDGDGTFDDATLMNAVYTPGAGDISTGIVGLTLTAYFGATPLVTDNMSIVITPAAIATFDYTVPNGSAQYCRCEPSNPSCIGNPISPNFTGGGIAGTFTATAGLLFFDTGASPSPTGQVDIANTPAGTYTVTNTVSNSCGDDVDTATIEILPLPEVIVEYPPGTFTTSDADQSPVTTGSDPGIFFSSYSATPAGLTINATTGVISPSTSSPGTYTVTRIATTAFCPNSKTTFVIIT